MHGLIYGYYAIGLHGDLLLSTTIEANCKICGG